MPYIVITFAVLVFLGLIVSLILRKDSSAPKKKKKKIRSKDRNKIIRDLIVKALTRLNTRYEVRPPLDLEFRKRLQVEFTAELEKLSKLLDYDLTYWAKGK